MFILKIMFKLILWPKNTVIYVCLRKITLYYKSAYHKPISLYINRIKCKE